MILFILCGQSSKNSRGFNHFIPLVRRDFSHALIDVNVEEILGNQAYIKSQHVCHINLTRDETTPLKDHSCPEEVSLTIHSEDEEQRVQEVQNVKESSCSESGICEDRGNGNEVGENTGRMMQMNAEVNADEHIDGTIWEVTCN